MNRAIYEAYTARLPLAQKEHHQLEKEEFVYPKSTRREDIINWFVNNQFIDHYVRKLLYDDDIDVMDDMIQEIYAEVCSWPQERWDRLTKQGYGALRAYMSGVIYRQIHSDASPLYYKYKKHKLREIVLNDESWKYYSENNEFKPPQNTPNKDSEGYSE